MAEDEKDIEGTYSHGTDWEFVSLTASAYAAAPGPNGFDPADQHKEPNYSEICNELGDRDVNPAEYEGDGPNKINEDNWETKSGDDLHGIQFSDKGKSVSVHDMEFGEGKTLQGLALVGEEQVIYDAPKFGAFHGETDISQSVLCDDTTDTPETSDPSYQNLDSPVDYTSDSKSNEGNKPDGSGLPCGAWWKRHAITLYSHVKETNKFWSVFVAAAVMGLVILGQRWRREKLQLQQLKWQSSINSERMNQMVGPINRFKGVLVGGHQRSPLIRGGATSPHLGI